MQWDLALPLLIILATILVMAFMFIAARNLLLQPRKDDRTDENSEGASEDD